MVGAACVEEATHERDSRTAAFRQVIQDGSDRPMVDEPSGPRSIEEALDLVRVGVRIVGQVEEGARRRGGGQAVCRDDMAREQASRLVENGEVAAPVGGLPAPTGHVYGLGFEPGEAPSPRRCLVRDRCRLPGIEHG